MRENEVLGLTWGDIDLRAGRIEVRAQLSRPRPGNPAHRVSVKSSPTRAVHIDPNLAQALRSHRERQFARARAKDTDYVFTTETGGPLNFRSLLKAFGKAADAAELNPDGKRRLRFHDLRHTYASILISGGCEGPYVAQQLGDASPAITYSVYARLFNARSQAEKGLAAIQAARGGGRL